MRTNPHILEVSAHSWLAKLSADLGRQITLKDVPQDVLFAFKQKGFDAVWLMGVWEESPSSRHIAQNDEGINERIKKFVPDYKKEDIMGSPYAIYGYSVHPTLGGNEALAHLRGRLNEMGIMLILDFAGNHLAIDHPLTLTQPDIFIRAQGEPEDKNLFFQTKNGDWLAHGKDPYFPPWTDTVQLNHFNPKTRQLLLQRLLNIEQMCDGVRCDMVMLMLNKIFSETWGKYNTFEYPAAEFWPDAIRAVREKNPSFIFMAEVYWGLEWDVQEMGFDYTYDKTLYDRLLLSSPQDIQGHLTAEHLYQMRSIRFTANHDEADPITAFGREKSLAAAAIAYSIPGARLLTRSQVNGVPLRLPIQYAAAPKFYDEEVYNFYHKFLDIINHPCFHGGQWVMKNPRKTHEHDNSCLNVLSWVWTQMTTIKIVVVNYSEAPANCFLNIDKVPEAETLNIREEFTGTDFTMRSGEAKSKGVRLDLNAYEVKVFSVDF